MAIQDDQVKDLAALHEAQQTSAFGWATDGCGVRFAAVDRLRQHELVETADGDTLSRLASAQTRSTPPQWAARLTREGRDTLAYLPVRRPQAPTTPTGSPRTGTREIALLPSEMDVLHLYLHIGDRLVKPPPPGLAEAVRTAQQTSGTQLRWVLHVTDEETDHIAYAMYLEGIAHSARPHNRLARDCDLRHRPPQLE
ncbi:hypothetical protein [Streptomyces klenkii]|uniref:hypothetical protein n=1 Tax=Streptomyces klenkii TaxID=1420899 RepID=UPI00341DFFE9